MVTHSRSAIMKLAHAMKRHEQRSFGSCQRQVWKMFHLLVKMATENKVSFSYIKSTGEVRMATGNLEGINVPIFRAKNGYIVRYFDLAANGPRSFHLSNLK